MNLYEKLTIIQGALKAPKNQYNSFGKYNYRSCEDIVEALKPLLVFHKVTMVIQDDIVPIGDRIYVKAKINIFNAEQPEEHLESIAFAREGDTQSGMSPAQITGSASSYARKYALNAMFAIDDTKDDDVTNTHQKTTTVKVQVEKSMATRDELIEKFNNLEKEKKDLYFKQYQDESGKVVSDGKYLTTAFLKKVFN